MAAILSRRRFLALGALASGAFLPASTEASPRSGGNALYSSDFVPEGARFTFAFVTDHHYWPNHFKNWDEKEMRHSGERMRDLVVTLNREAPDLSIHCGDLVNAGTAFEPPYDEYIRQLDFEKTFLNALRHKAIPLIGNHESPDAMYQDESELDQWKKRFGPLYRYVDIQGWRFVCLNIMVPNKEGALVCGIEGEQLRWLDGVLKDAAAKSMRALLFAHYQPSEFTFKNNFEQVVNATGCVKGMFCGHTHANSRAMLGNVPVLVRASNSAAPFAYSMVHVYPDDRVLVVQKSQHFPFLEYLSNAIMPGLQGKEEDRYYTLYGSTELPLENLRVVGDTAAAAIRDGHLTFRSEKGPGFLLLDTPALSGARLKVTAVKEGAVRMGLTACADERCLNRIDAAVTSEFGTDGNIYLARHTQGKKETLTRTWFNIADGISYEFILEVRKGKITLSMTNMPGLTARVDRTASGRCGLFVEGGKMIVTGISLEKA
jgi:hypothetical protein